LIDDRARSPRPSINRRETRARRRDDVFNLPVSTRDRVMDWLLAGDPAIRWQVHLHLLDSGPRVVKAERARVAGEGWGRRLLELQSPNGRWAADRGPARYRGLYIPKWTSTTYTLQLLARLGLPAENAAAQRGCRALVEGAEWFPSGGLGFFASRRIAEPCVSSMVLQVLEAFDGDAGARARLRRFLVETQLPDGGWNCDEASRRGSFHTTTMALEALRNGRAAESAREFLLDHRLYRSKRTGRPVRPSFERLRWPVGWEADVLRQLEVFVDVDAPRDARLEDAIALIDRRRRADGRWRASPPQAGALHFALEESGAPSRWVTLKCLKILRWWRAE
jgi:hypothetical protein